MDLSEVKISLEQNVFNQMLHEMAVHIETGKRLLESSHDECTLPDYLKDATFTPAHDPEGVTNINWFGMPIREEDNLAKFFGSKYPKAEKLPEDQAQKLPEDEENAN